MEWEYIITVGLWYSSKLLAQIVISDIIMGMRTKEKEKSWKTENLKFKQFSSILRLLYLWLILEGNISKQQIHREFSPL